MKENKEELKKHEENIYKQLSSTGHKNSEVYIEFVESLHNFLKVFSL